MSAHEFEICFVCFEFLSFVLIRQYGIVDPTLLNSPR